MSPDLLTTSCETNIIISAFIITAVCPKSLFASSRLSFFHSCYPISSFVCVKVQLGCWSCAVCSNSPRRPLALLFTGTRFFSRSEGESFNFEFSRASQTDSGATWPGQDSCGDVYESDRRCLQSWCWCR